MPANRPLPGQAIPGMPDIDPRAGQFQQSLRSMVATPDDYYRWERDQRIAEQEKKAADRRQISQDMFAMMRSQREQPRAGGMPPSPTQSMLIGSPMGALSDLIAPQRPSAILASSASHDVEGIYNSPEDWGIDPGWLEGAQGQKAREWIEGQYLDPDFNRRVTTEDFWDEARRIDSYE